MRARSASLLCAAAILAGVVGAVAATWPGADPGPPDRAAALRELAESGRSVIVVTRAAEGRLSGRAAAATASAAAFSAVVARTFAPEGGPAGAHSPPRPLPARAPLAGGFVATATGYDGHCGLAVGGLDYTGAGGTAGLDAAAALIFCAESEEALAAAAAPDLVAERLASVPPD